MEQRLHNRGVLYFRAVVDLAGLIEDVAVHVQAGGHCSVAGAGDRDGTSERDLCGIDALEQLLLGSRWILHDGELP